MSIINIISALGNNRGIAPLFVRDCCIEIPTKVGLTYNQNLKDSKQMAKNATRERLIDEYGTSAVWIGGPIILDRLSNWIIKKFGYNANVNMSLFKERKNQGIKYNIEKFKELAPDAVADLEKALKNKNKFQNLQAFKFALSTIIPITLMGFILPKLNFKLTEKIKTKQDLQKKSDISDNNYSNEPVFKGIVSTMANMTTVNKMAVTDGGLTIGRVLTGRNRYEQAELGFKNAMMMFLNFVFPIYLAKGLDNLTMKLFKINVKLDPKLLADKEFLEYIKNNNIEVPDNKDNIIEFLDKKSNSKFADLCKEYCGVKYLKNGIRDPREFVDTNKIENFRKEIINFSKQLKTNNNIDNYAKKALRAKSANILANVGISSFLLAVALPELIFFLRKKITGSDAEPGLLK